MKDFDGSFSAEHGVGPHNQAFYERYVDAKVRETASGPARDSLRQAREHPYLVTPGISQDSSELPSSRRREAAPKLLTYQLHGGSWFRLEDE